MPWNANTVHVHARISLPPSVAWSNNDFELQATSLSPLTARKIEPCAEEDVFDVQFRCPPFQRPILVTIFCKGKYLGQVSIPFLSADAFLQSLRLEAATVAASLGALEIPCQSVVEGQSSLLTATALLSSSYSLLPVIDFDIAAEFTNKATRQARTIRQRLSGDQLRAKQACLCATIRDRQGADGELIGQWRIENHVLARWDVRTVGRDFFYESIYLAKSRYIYRESRGPLGRVPIQICSISGTRL